MDTIKDNQSIKDDICAALAEGRSLRSICKQADMPSTVTVFKWLREDAAFLNQYTRAREAQADALVEEILEIADDASNDWMAREDPENPGFNLMGEHIQRSKVRIDARKWYASKLAPKKYGDKVEQTLTGEVAVRNVRVNVLPAVMPPTVTGNGR